MSCDNEIELKKYQPLWGQLNKETKEHSLRVATLCEGVAEELNLDAELAYRIGYLHDIGKIYLPSRILKKNCKLTPVEREIVDLHAYIGYVLLKDIGEPGLVCLSALYHHGFDKCRLNNIIDFPNDRLAFLYFSLIYSADIFDARSNKRVYHNAVASNEIFNTLESDWLCEARVLQALRNYVSRQSNKSNACV